MSFFVVVRDEEAGKNRPFATFSHAQPVRTQKKGRWNDRRGDKILSVFRP